MRQRRVEKAGQSIPSDPEAFHSAASGAASRPAGSTGIGTMSGLARSAARRAAVAAVIIVLCVWAATRIRLASQLTGPGRPAIVDISALMLLDRQCLWPAG